MQLIVCFERLNDLYEYMEVVMYNFAVVFLNICNEVEVILLPDPSQPAQHVP